MEPIRDWYLVKKDERRIVHAFEATDQEAKNVSEWFAESPYFVTCEPDAQALDRWTHRLYTSV